jgi:GH35 family endo-1,4-beta-xylanase
MNDKELLSSASQRIQQNRSAEIEIVLVDQNGKPLSNSQARAQLVRHEFKFGCDAFLLQPELNTDLQRDYQERFSALLNYATLPFYWGGYERTKGETGEKRLQRMAEWCARHEIATKGHPLVWHEVYPAWGHDSPDNEVLSRLEKRVTEIVSQFRGKVDIWDVVNEATVSHRFDNAIGRWIAEKGAVECVAQALHWAREANRSATLLYNDFNVSEDMVRLVADLLDLGAPLDAIGIQSHMHKSTWTLEKAWEACEAFAGFGLPLHWTELTVLSGRLKAPADNDWHFRHTDWKTTPQGEETQAEYATKLYTLLFSHPSVEAITWWDLSDHASWQGAPAGLIREDMTPKPLYERLLRLVSKEWSTDVQTTTDENGRIRLRAFYGQYHVHVGANQSGTFEHHRRGDQSTKVMLCKANT